MRFYALRAIEDKNQEGPSIRGFRDGYDIELVNSATRICRYKKIEFDPDMDFVLANDAKATDLLQPPYTIGSDCMMVSPRIHEIMMSAKLLEHQCLDAVVRDDGRLLDYFFMHFYFRFDSDENDLVDFAKTKFVASEVTGPLSMLALPTDEKGVEGEFQVNSWEEFHSLRNRQENDCWHKVIRPLERLYVKRPEFLDLDLFYVEFGNYGLRNFVVSEKLAALIREAHGTGIALSPLSFEFALS